MDGSHSLRYEATACVLLQAAARGGGGGGGGGEDDELASDFDYLLSMPIWALTQEKATALKEELRLKTLEIARLKSISHGDMWRTDLSLVESEIKAHVQKEAAAEAVALKDSIAKRTKVLKASKLTPTALARALAELGRVLKGERVMDASNDVDDALAAEGGVKAITQKKKALKAATAVSLLFDSGANMEESKDDSVPEEEPVAKKPGVVSAKAAVATKAAPATKKAPAAASAAAAPRANSLFVQAYAQRVKQNTAKPQELASDAKRQKLAAPVSSAAPAAVAAVSRVKRTTVAAVSYKDASDEDASNDAAEEENEADPDCMILD